jgi:hypothetical protein
MYEGGNNEDGVRTSRGLYELRVYEFGEVNEYTIEVGRNYAIDLRKATTGMRQGNF